MTLVSAPCLLMANYVYMLRHFSLSLQASIEALSEFDTEAAAGIRNINHMREEEFAHLLAMEQQAPSTSRSAFMRRAVRNILVDSIDWQFQALSQVRFKGVTHTSACLIMHSCVSPCTCACVCQCVHVHGWGCGANFAIMWGNGRHHFDETNLFWVF